MKKCLYSQVKLSYYFAHVWGPLCNIPILKLWQITERIPCTDSAFSMRDMKKCFPCDMHFSKMLYSVTKFLLNTTLDSELVLVNQK